MKVNSQGRYGEMIPLFNSSARGSWSSCVFQAERFFCPGDFKSTDAPGTESGSAMAVWPTNASRRTVLSAMAGCGGALLLPAQAEANGAFEGMVIRGLGFVAANVMQEVLMPRFIEESKWLLSAMDSIIVERVRPQVVGILQTIAELVELLATSVQNFLNGLVKFVRRKGNDKEHSDFDNPERLGIPGELVGVDFNPKAFIRKARNFGKGPTPTFSGGDWFPYGFSVDERIHARPMIEQLASEHFGAAQPRDVRALSVTPRRSLLPNHKRAIVDDVNATVAAVEAKEALRSLNELYPVKGAQEVKLEEIRAIRPWSLEIPGVGTQEVQGITIQRGEYRDEGMIKPYFRTLFVP